MLYIAMVRYRSWMSLYLSSMTKDFVLTSAIVARTNLRSSSVVGLFLRFLLKCYERIEWRQKTATDEATFLENRAPWCSLQARGVCPLVLST